MIVKKDESSGDYFSNHHSSIIYPPFSADIAVNNKGLQNVNPNI
jgi:hypothetical protein